MYTQLLTTIKNAQAAKKKELKVPYSIMDERVLDVLVKGKFIEGFEKKGRSPKRILDVKLKTGESLPISGVKFISVPSRRLYAGYKDLRPVKSGYGILVISTPKGIMTGYEARKKKLGGELLFQIW